MTDDHTPEHGEFIKQIAMKTATDPDWGREWLAVQDDGAHHILALLPGDTVAHMTDMLASTGGEANVFVKKADGSVVLFVAMGLEDVELS